MVTFKKIFAVCLLMFACSSIDAQSFLNNDDIMYGAGSGNTIEEADHNALVDFTYTYGTKVRATSSVKTKQVNGVQNNKADFEVNTNTEINLPLTHRFVKINRNNTYTVYRYVSVKQVTAQYEQMALKYYQVGLDFDISMAPEYRVNRKYLWHKCIEIFDLPIMQEKKTKNIAIYEKIKKYENDN